MSGSVSRRSFLAGLGGGLASAALAFGLWKYNLGPHGAHDANPVPECCNYVDYAGWMLTKSDKDRLVSEGTIQILQASRFEGNDIADQVVADLNSCQAWCLGEPDCQGFSYAAPSHPDPNTQNRCWLKGTSQLTPVADPLFISGLRR